MKRPRTPARCIHSPLAAILKKDNRMRIALIIISLIGLSCTRNANRNSMITCAKSGIDSISKYEFQSYDDAYLHIDSITKAEYENCKQTDYSVNIDTSIKIRENNELLILPIVKGKSVTLIDSIKTECDDPVGQFQYVGIFKGTNYYIISKYIGHDSHDYFLINRADGHKYSLLDKPYISQNKKIIFTFSAYLEFSIKPTGFQLWKIDDQGLKLLDNVNLDKWQIREIRWVTDNQIAIH